MLRLVWLIMGCVFLVLGLSMWIRKLLCTTEVEGKFVGWDSMTPKKDGQQFAPVFEFTLEDEWYSCRSFECFSMKKVEDRFKKEHYYKIYVNKKRPKDMIIARKFYAEDYLILVAAFVAFCLSLPI